MQVQRREGAAKSKYLARVGTVPHTLPPHHRYITAQSKHRRQQHRRQQHRRQQHRRKNVRQVVSDPEHRRNQYRGLGSIEKVPARGNRIEMYPISNTSVFISAYLEGRRYVRGDKPPDRRNTHKHRAAIRSSLPPRLPETT